MDHAELARRIAETPHTGKRRLIALAGPPASGKSTLAATLATQIDGSAVVPMDGFHLDNRLLDARRLRARKGAPETFDVAGLCHLLHRLRREEDVIFPIFDRALDCAVAGAGHVDASVHTIIAEGNYLLYDAPGWRDLAPLWDLTVHLTVQEHILRMRLMQRWHDHGLPEAEARSKTEQNDLPNAATVAAHLIPPDITIPGPEI